MMILDTKSRIDTPYTVNQLATLQPDARETSMFNAVTHLLIEKIHRITLVAKVYIFEIWNLGGDFYLQLQIIWFFFWIMQRVQKGPQLRTCIIMLFVLKAWLNFCKHWLWNFIPHCHSCIYCQKYTPLFGCSHNFRHCGRYINEKGEVVLGKGVQKEVGKSSCKRTFFQRWMFLRKINISSHPQKWPCTRIQEPLAPGQ